MVTGTAFTFTNGIAGLFIGQYADKLNRKWMLFIAACGWNFFSFMESYCHVYWQILIVRMLFAIFMSANVITSVTLLSDYVVPKERGIAQSVFAAGMYLGVGLSSASIAFDEAFG